MAAAGKVNIKIEDVVGKKAVKKPNEQFNNT